MIKNFNFEYCGFSTFITPVDGVGGILAKWLSNKHNVIVPTPYTFGQDPIPGVNLYRNTKAKFVMANGGNSLPCAMAKYNTKTGQFIHITSDNDFSPIIRETRVMKKYFIYSLIFIITDKTKSQHGIEK
ncbi:cytoplasmic protein [Salmonella enterica subsp. enterica serovar Enteritidis]|nr:cytoplasmic protein [Salmonella enterica subsp. enterica serovar Enteritidis]EEB9296465.1 cytoplasmic protein [Salmonella enterica subsp. enterica serovar Enteritidis]EGR7014731.1 cytoplasmic protein [Salmonella enterica subsp. enterica serovar Enteritidis]HCM2666815.1 cytoplasmic protein [Salmonella enterica subsp. enterica serovar Enteritidis]